MRSTVAFLFLTLVPMLAAGEIRVSFSFEKKPPVVGLVYMKDDAGLTFDKKPVVDQKNKQFVDKVVVVTPGSELQLNNSDEISHNIYANDLGNNVSFDIGLAEPGTTIPKEVDWEKDLVVRIGCKIHPQMRSWIATIESRYYQIVPFEKTELTSEVVLEGVPDALEVVAVWLPGYEPLEVTLGASGRLEIDLMKRGKKKGTVVLSRD